MKLGTKSVLFGAHCFFIHPLEMLAAWWKLQGFPFDPRLWVAFVIHDWGYWGCPKMEDGDGAKHPEWAAKVMVRLFDPNPWNGMRVSLLGRFCNWVWGDYENHSPRSQGQFFWYYFVLCHSRYLARFHGLPLSSLCAVDKIAPFMVPRWFYLLRVWLTGELKEYVSNAVVDRNDPNFVPEVNVAAWYSRWRQYITGPWLLANTVPFPEFRHENRTP